MAAYEIPGFSFSLPASADYSTGAGQFRFVVVNGSGQASAPAAGGAIVGVRQNKPKMLEATTIVHSGIVMVEAGEAIAIGANVTPSNVGKAMNGGTAGETVVGVALTAAGDDGELLTVLLGSANPVVPA